MRPKIPNPIPRRSIDPTMACPKDMHDSQIKQPPRMKRGSSRPKIDMRTAEGKSQYQELIKRRNKEMVQKKIELSRVNGYKEKLLARMRRCPNQNSKKRIQSVGAYKRRKPQWAG